jgi:hypothetical protein
MFPYAVKSRCIKLVTIWDHVIVTSEKPKRITIYQDGDRNTILIRGNFEDLVPQMYTFFFLVL